MNGDVAQGGRRSAAHLPGLARRGDFAVDGVVDGPERGVGVDGLRLHQVLGLGEGTLLRQPEELLHSFEDEIGFGLVGGGVFAEGAGERGGEAEGEDVVGGGVGRAAAVVLQVVAGPDGGVGLVEREGLTARGGIRAAEEAVLPGEVALEGGPYLAGEVEVAGPHEVTQHHVHEDHVHVVVIAGEVAVGVEHLLLAGEMEVGRVVPWADGGIGGGDGGEVLALEPVADVQDCAVVVAEGVEDVWAAPSGEHGAPGDAAVQDTLRVRVPDGFGGDGDGWAEGVEVLVGGVEGEGCGEGGELGAARGELSLGIVRRRTSLIAIDADVEGFLLDLGRADQDRMDCIVYAP